MCARAQMRASRAHLAGYAASCRPTPMTGKTRSIWLRRRECAAQSCRQLGNPPGSDRDRGASIASMRCLRSSVRLMARASRASSGAANVKPPPGQGHPDYMHEQLAKLSRGHDLAKVFNYILKRWRASRSSRTDVCACPTTKPSGD